MMSTDKTNTRKRKCDLSDDLFNEPNKKKRRIDENHNQTLSSDSESESIDAGLTVSSINSMQTHQFHDDHTFEEVIYDQMNENENKENKENKENTNNAMDIDDTDIDIDIDNWLMLMSSAKNEVKLRFDTNEVKNRAKNYHVQYWDNTMKKYSELQEFTIERMASTGVIRLNQQELNTASDENGSIKLQICDKNLQKASKNEVEFINPQSDNSDISNPNPQIEMSPQQRYIGNKFILYWNIKYQERIMGKIYFTIQEIGTDATSPPIFTLPYTMKSEQKPLKIAIAVMIRENGNDRMLHTFLKEITPFKESKLYQIKEYLFQEKESLSEGRESVKKCSMVSESMTVSDLVIKKRIIYNDSQVYPMMQDWKILKLMQESDCRLHFVEPVAISIKQNECHYCTGLMITKSGGQDLRLYKKHNIMTEPIMKLICIQMISMEAALHKIGFIDIDRHPGNYVLNDINFQLKGLDFECCVSIKTNNAITTKYVTTDIGNSKYYLSKFKDSRIGINNDTYYANSSFISIGKMILWLLQKTEPGTNPADPGSNESTLEKINKYDNLSEAGKNFVRCCLDINASINNIITNDYLNKWTIHSTLLIHSRDVWAKIIPVDKNCKDNKRKNKKHHLKMAFTVRGGEDEVDITKGLANIVNQLEEFCDRQQNGLWITEDLKNQILNGKLLNGTEIKNCQIRNEMAMFGFQIDKHGRNGKPKNLEMFQAFIRMAKI